MADTDKKYTSVAAERKKMQLLKAQFDAVNGELGNAVYVGGGGSQASTPSFDPETQTVHITAQTLSSQQKAQARENIGAGSAEDVTEALKKAEETTWAALKAKRDAGQLTPGMWYRITDYQCTTTQENTQSAGHQFDIIVRADSTDTLNENAYAAHHAGDTYFANSKLEAWKLLYCLDNDTSRFAWAGGKSITISNKNYYRNKAIDVIGATYPYCWSSDGNKRYTASETPSTGDNAYSKSTGGTSYTISSINEETGKGVIYKMVDEADNDCPYDFKNIQFKVGAKEKAGTVANVFYYTFSVASGTNDATVTDHSLNGLYCYNNRIVKWITNSTQKLNFNVFRNTSTTALCNSNTFGDGCFSNTFGNSCSGNTFGNNCLRNTFGDNYQFNTFGNSCIGNTFGNSYQSNTFGNNCSSNTFGNSCSGNTFGNSCSGNTFGNNCSGNTFGNNCSSNTFGDNCQFNTFGNNCIGNTFGNSCQSNTFGNNCIGNTFLKDYSCYIIIENGNQYIDITSTQTTSSSNKLQNFTVAQGVNNTSTRKTISHDTVNDTFKTTYQNASSTTVNV